MIMIRVTAILALLAPVVWIGYLQTTGTAHSALAYAFGPLLFGLLLSALCTWFDQIMNGPRTHR